MHVEAAITQLAYDEQFYRRRGWPDMRADRKARLDRAKAIYRKLTGAEWAPRLSKMSQLSAQIAALTAQQEGEAASRAGALNAT
jgi:hypothetical protein